jgi:hypothetical protein
MAIEVILLRLPFLQQSAASLKWEHLVLVGRRKAYFRCNGHYRKALAKIAIFSRGEICQSVAMGGRAGRLQRMGVGNRYTFRVARNVPEDWQD